MPIDADLPVFDSLTGPWTGILIGNGASRAVSSGFAYQSLFTVAQQASLSNPLTVNGVSLFEAFDTTNFERVLSYLISARLINGILGVDIGPISTAYQSVRTALIQAVHAVHIQWEAIPEDTLLKIRAALKSYKFVYSTNYDLIAYWAVMKDQTGFVDYFFGPLFDASNTEVWGEDVTRLMFLHGALHLCRTNRGTLKRAGSWGGNILETFGDPVPDYPSAVPLFVSEGSSENKLASIRSNDYLSFVYGEFVSHSGGLVIVGQSLEPAHDQHLINAIRGRRGRRLAVAIYRGSRTDIEIMNEKTSWLARFDGYDFSIDFFDSTTHPLGAPDLFVY